MEFDSQAVVNLANNCPSFRLAARHWTSDVAFDVGDHCYILSVVDGLVTDFAPTEVGGGAGQVSARVCGPADSWNRLLTLIPPPGFDHLASSRTHPDGIAVEGDLIELVAPYFAALQEFVSILREVRCGPAPSRPVKDPDRDFDAAVGRYVYVPIQGVRYRVYFEEAGTGSIPLLLQHTAGADGRQWRHVLEDADYQRLFRMISYDLPFHGRSLPPTSVRWWENEYRLTKAFLMDAVLGISRALDLHRPAYMGCSVGGHLAPDLALNHPDEFRAVIGINSGLASRSIAGDAIPQSFFHPRVANDWKAAMMLGNTAPTSPEAYRRETTWIYSQGAPPILKGDVFYYAKDHDLTPEQAQTIDTSKVAVYLLTGEYDFLAHDQGTAELARNIPGCHFQIIPGLGHFGPSENPEDFKPFLLPVLEKIAAQ